MHANLCDDNDGDEEGRQMCVPTGVTGMPIAMMR